MPVQFAALALTICLLLRRSASLDSRTAWWWVLAFTAISPVASLIWNTVRTGVSRETLSLADWLYLVDYAALTSAFAIWFAQAGGTFRRRRVWLDAMTMIVVLLVGLWSFFLGPSVANGTGGGISLTAIAAYSITIVSMMSMAALLCLQLPSYRDRLPVLLLVAAGTADAVWEIMWMASWLTDRDFIGRFYNFGDVVCFAAVVSAIAATQFRGQSMSGSVKLDRPQDSFVPALAVLVAIALVAGSLASTRRSDAWLLVGLVALSASLLITRQMTERRELHALNRQLAKRDADARLTELVRRSADLILVVGSDGRVTFASPATETFLGMPSDCVQELAAAQLFGSHHAAALSAFLERAASGSAMPSYTELRVRQEDGGFRVFKITAVNQISNDLIGGIVLAISDTSEQRSLEREVLDAASRERARLSGEIHDGLGQELVGIALLLKGTAMQPGSATTAQLLAIVDQINRAVGSARDLARGLSPLSVVRGSLGHALRRLVPESSIEPSVRIDVEPACETQSIDDFCADHLYQIAQEAVRNAMRHSRCTKIAVGLRSTESQLILAIRDNGQGYDEPAADYPGLGLRLMEYRARIIGGTLSIEHQGGDGTCVTVTVPTQSGQIEQQHFGGAPALHGNASGVRHF